MDIYKYAEDINYSADYYEAATGKLYHIRDYGIDLKRGFAFMGIPVTQDGMFIGWAERNDCNN